MPQGYTGKILRINLTDQTTHIDELDDVLLRRYLGGGLLGAYFLYRETLAGMDPLAPEAPLIFMTSAMNGTTLSGSNRYSAVAKSPLTGGFGESEAGGYWGPALKRAGFDGLIITGKADRPTYLHLWDGQCEFRDAEPYWGKNLDSVAVQEGIQAELAELGHKVIVLQTGIAGENLVRFAALVNNCKHFHGRCGLGAVMGSKCLKAIAVGGKQKVTPADPEKVKSVQKWYKTNYHHDEDMIHLYGTTRGVHPLNANGILPTRNFRDGSFDEYENLTGERMVETILTKRGTCYGCDVVCKREVEVEELGVTTKYGGPEYETVAATGSLCGVSDLEQIALFNQLLNGYVLDSISTGASIAFAMEAYEKGILTKEQTGGLELTYGDPEVVKTLIHQIAKREGWLGDLLAEGVKSASEALGPEAETFALHVRGQELPMHDPRGKTGLAIAYATSPTGADHLEAPHDQMLEFVDATNNPLGGLGLLEPVPPLELSLRKVRMFVYAQKFWGAFNVIGLCNFVAAPINALKLEPIVDHFNAVTGWDLSVWELLKAAERSSALFRMYNHREGMGTDEDRLPDRLFEPLEKGALKGTALDRDQFDQALHDYYEMMGWDRQTGLPTRATLAELELDWLVDAVPELAEAIV